MVLHQRVGHRARHCTSHGAFCVVYFLEPESVGGQFWLAALNAIIRGVVLVYVAVLVARLSLQMKMLSQRVRQLEGLLPICMFCKSIRNEADKWVPIESYLLDRTKAQFSHGFCDPCGRIHYPEMFSSPS